MKSFFFRKFRKKVKKISSEKGKVFISSKANESDMWSWKLERREA